jgi:hypothetical protein
LKLESQKLFAQASLELWSSSSQSSMYLGLQVWGTSAWQYRGPLCQLWGYPTERCSGTSKKGVWYRLEGQNCDHRTGGKESAVQTGYSLSLEGFYCCF